MMIDSFRHPESRERELIRKLLVPEFPGRAELSRQLETATVRTIDEDGSIELMIVSDVKASSVKYVVPTEGEYEDPDGVTVHVLLHVEGDRAKEIEFYREDGARVQSWPHLDAMRVFAPE